jgi:hypothetical protein
MLVAGLAAILCSCGRAPEPAGTTGTPPTATSGSNLATNKPGVLSAGFRDWIKTAWDTNSFETGLHFAAEGEPRARALALEKLFTKRSSMSAQELQQFRATLEKQVRTRSDPPLVVAASIRTLAQLLDYLKERGLVTDVDIAAEGAVLLQHMRDTSLDLQVRGAAIRAAGDLGVSDARPSVEVLLADAANVDTAEIARNGCLALLKLSGQQSFRPVRLVFERTSQPAIFGTAAYCLGQINTPEAMSTLVLNARRFPDSASCDAALVNMEPVILDALKHPEQPEALAAIRATEHLWKDGQRAKYVAALRDVLVAGPLVARQASCARLIEAAGQLPFEQEKKELHVVLDSIGDSADLASYAEKIGVRMRATVLTPIAGHAAVAIKREQ